MKVEKPIVRITGELEWVGPWRPEQTLSDEAIERLAHILAGVLIADLRKHPDGVEMKPRPVSPAGENLSVGEVAKRLGVSSHLIRRWVARRQIPFIRFGRRIVFAANDIEAFQARNRIREPDKERRST